MRSMRLAALTVAMTLVFSGLALAGTMTTTTRTNTITHKYDHDKDRQMIITVVGRTCGITKGSDREMTIGSESERIRDHERWEREHRKEATTAARFTTVIPQLPGRLISGRRLRISRNRYGRGGYGGGKVPAARDTVRACRTARTRRARMLPKANRSTQIRGAQATPIMGTTAIWATRMFIRRRTIRATVQVINPTSAGVAEDGDSKHHSRVK